MKKYFIPILLVLVVIGLTKFIKPTKLQAPLATSTPNLGIEPTLSIPNLSNASVETQAWGNFQDYLKAAKNHDLTSLKKFSYQLSPECSDPSRESECFKLMDSLSDIAGEFKQADFKNIAYDDKQVVLSTDFLPLESPTKVVLYFVRDESKFPKMLGIRFCYGDETKAGRVCVNTDPATRDSNKNGWWDDVEALFNK